MSSRLLLILSSLAVAVIVSAQPVAGPADSFQITYAAQLDKADAAINITNTGTEGGNICVNMYAFSPDEQMISCCSCLVTPNALVSLSVLSDLISNTLTPAVPTSIVVPFLASRPVGGTCNPSSPMATTLASGMSGWTEYYSQDEKGAKKDKVSGGWSKATLSTDELTRLTSLCGFIQANGSGFGICKSCRLGGLGADQERASAVRPLVR